MMITTIFRRLAAVVPAVIFGILLTTVAHAATRTVCYRVGFLDDRLADSCATSSDAGARRACKTGGAVNDAVGHFIELWDKDDSGKDEFIGTFVISGTGRRCATFEWEGSSASKGETHPDVYIRMTNRVRKTGSSGTAVVEARDHNGRRVAAPIWRNGVSGDSDRFVARNCTTAGPCQIRSGKTLIPSGDTSSVRMRRAIALDTAQHMVQVYGAIMTDDVEMRFPCDPFDDADDTRNCRTSNAPRRDRFLIDNDESPLRVPAHELGHNLQMQIFGQNVLRGECGASHSVNLASASDSCATTEGFADYVAVVAFWDPGNTSSAPRFLGVGLEPANLLATPCSANRRIEVQVAKAFWDLDDANNESGVGSQPADQANEDTLDIAEGWADFANGTSNREDYENDPDGVNIWDYFQNTTGMFGGTSFEQTLVHHNCLTTQDP